MRCSKLQIISLIFESHEILNIAISRSLNENPGDWDKLEAGKIKVASLRDFLCSILENICQD